MIPEINVDEMLTSSWDQLLARDLASEIKLFSGDKRCLILESRRVFAIRDCRDLLHRLRTVSEGEASFDALKSVSRKMRQYTRERPALWASASRTPTTDCAEWRAGHKELCDLIKSVFAECGVQGPPAEDALYMLRSLMRGFAAHQILGLFLHGHSYVSFGLQY